MDRTRRQDEGSIVLMMVVMLVATGLVLTTIVAVERGLRTSRRSGDSANALQVADAAVNDAMQAIPTVAGTSFTRSAVLGEETWPGSCPAGKDCYTFTATRDLGERPVWHIDATGTDKTGVQRRIRATAVATSLFATPLFVQSSLDVSSGVSLDSFNNGTTVDDMCTKKGVIATNTPSGMTFGSSGVGGGVTNCQNKLLSNGWSYSMDGCTSYGDGDQNLPPMGPAKCPPEPDTFRTNREFSPPEVKAPVACAPGGGEVYGTCYNVGNPTQTTPFICGSGPGQFQLEGGKTYYFPNVSLRKGCGIITPKLISGGGGGIDLEEPVIVYANRITVGAQSDGADQRINQPPSGPGAGNACGGTATSTLQDGNSAPANFYCPKWSGGLRLRIVEGQLGTITFKGSGTKFWGAMEAPDGSVDLEGSQTSIWGAVVANFASSDSQFSWHFDDSLAAITTTQFELGSWREEPLK